MLIPIVERRGPPSLDLPEEVQQSYCAFSAYDTVAGLKEQARQICGMGRHIVRYDIPEGAGITWKQILAPGHFDLWGDKEELKRYLVGYVADVWDTEVSRYLGHFADEQEALTLVRMLVRHHGRGYADDLGLGRSTEEGEILEPLSGATLLARVDEVLGDDQASQDRRGEVIASRALAH